MVNIVFLRWAYYCVKLFNTDSPIITVPIEIALVSTYIHVFPDCFQF